MSGVGADPHPFLSGRAGSDDDRLDAVLAGAKRAALWLDDGDRPPRRPPLDSDLLVDLAVVGGGFTGLWAAIQAAEADPARTVVLLEAASLGWAASGRNGGFCSASLTHGLGNGAQRWPEEMPDLLRLGRENLDAILDTVAAQRIDCHLERSGELSVAVTDWQVEDLRELYSLAQGLGEDAEWLDLDAVQGLVRSPTFRAGVFLPGETVLVNPARLLWGLAAYAERLGVIVHERTRLTGLSDEVSRVRLETTSGVVRARRVVLGTNAFPSPLGRVRPFVVPVWDHVLATQPLSAEQKGAIGWDGRAGVSDSGNQFHYYRLTADDRIVGGGFDALYYFGSDLAARRQKRPETERMLARNLLTTFPQLEGISFSHIWAGAIDTCSRFSPFWIRALGGKVVSVQGYTGLGVGASRFGAGVSLDLLDGKDTPRTKLEMVRTKPVPFPPEPLRWLGIQATRWSTSRADANGGRRNLWLRSLDRLGMGFDS